MPLANNDMEKWVASMQRMGADLMKPGSPALMKMGLIRGIEATAPLTSGGKSRGTQETALRMFGAEMSPNALRNKMYLKGKASEIMEKDISAGRLIRPQIIGGRVKIEVEMTLENIRKMPMLLNNAESNKSVALHMGNLLRKLMK